MTENLALHTHARQRQRSAWVMMACIVISLLSLAVSLLSGSYPISWQDYLAIFYGQVDTPAYLVFHDLRWPRALSAFATGDSKHIGIGERVA